MQMILYCGRPIMPGPCAAYKNRAVSTTRSVSGPAPGKIAADAVGIGHDGEGAMLGWQ